MPCYLNHDKVKIVFLLELDPDYKDEWGGRVDQAKIKTNYFLSLISAILSSCSIWSQAELLLPSSLCRIAGS
jgi:hypothetical protein